MTSIANESFPKGMLISFQKNSIVHSSTVQYVAIFICVVAMLLFIRISNNIITQSNLGFPSSLKKLEFLEFLLNETYEFCLFVARRFQENHFKTHEDYL